MSNKDFKPTYQAKGGLGRLLIDADGVLLYEAYDVRTGNIVTVALCIDADSYTSLVVGVEECLQECMGTNRVIH